MKKLLLAAVSFAVFTLNGLDRVQLAAVIAFSAGVFAGRWFSPDGSGKPLPKLALLRAELVAITSQPFGYGAGARRPFACQSGAAD
jgi:hypothetical protein